MALSILCATTSMISSNRASLGTSRERISYNLFKFISNIEVGCRGKKLLDRQEAKVLSAIEAPTSGMLILCSKLKSSFTGVVESINGRAAMVGMIFAMPIEVVTGQPLSAQLLSALSDSRTLMFCALLAIASSVPFLKGQMLQVFGPFNVQNEVLQGRMAMLALITVLALEGAKGSVLL